MRLYLTLLSMASLPLMAQQLKVNFVTSDIVRVRYTAEQEFRAEANNTGVLVEQPLRKLPVETIEHTDKTVIQSPVLVVEIDKQTQAITFKDRTTGRVLLQENPQQPRVAGKTFTEKIVYDESTKRAVQTADGQKEEMDILRRDTIDYTWRYRTYFNWQEGEALYGLGSHVEDFLNLRGHTQWLTQHNLKAMVPVLNSTQGYGLLFDAGCAMVFNDDNYNPILGNPGYIELDAAKELDYYFMKGESMDDVIGQYRLLTGQAPMMPRFLFGYTQSKERYTNQHEVIETLAEYRRRQVPIDMIVQDWNYWPQGWGYMHMDPKYYPDPKGMADSVHMMNARLMVSIWPNPQGCPQFDEYNAKGFMLPHSVYDAFSAEARDTYWQTAYNEFFSKDFDAWWTDCSEPLDGDWKPMPKGYDHNSHRERWESTKQILTEALGAERSSLYSLYHARGIYEHQRGSAQNLTTSKPHNLTTSEKRVVNLTRSSYAGQQRYSTITWNGDTYASWESFRKQIPAGLNFMATGCPYWSVDVGSFFTAPDRWHRWFCVGEFPEGCNDPAYREYYTRMFQWGTFLPMLRSHGTDTPREIWRFGEPGTPFYDAILQMIHLRYQLLPYNYSLAARVTRDHYTMARLLAFDFAQDKQVLDLKDEYMFGPAFLVCPVTEPSKPQNLKTSQPQNLTTRKVYLPQGTAWYDFWTNDLLEGGQWIDAPAPLDKLPLYVRAGSIVPMGPVKQYADEATDAPLRLMIYPGADATFTLYDDEGDNYNCEAGAFCEIPLLWNDHTRTLSIGARTGQYPGMKRQQAFTIILPDGTTRRVNYKGRAMQVRM